MKLFKTTAWACIVAMCAFACDSSKPNVSKVQKEVQQMLESYHRDMSDSGLMAEFKYLDNSDDFFWNPPGYDSTLNYSEVRAEITKNSKIFKQVNYQWKSLRIYPLTATHANFSGIVKGEMTVNSGAGIKVEMLESGTVIKRNDGWKILSGQTALLKSESDVSHEFFIYHLKLTPKYRNLGAWNEGTENIINRHSAFLDSLGLQGTLLLAGRTKLAPGDDNLFGIAIIKAASLDDAQVILAGDPAVVNGIQQATIFPFSMGIRHFSEFERP